MEYRITKVTKPLDKPSFVFHDQSVVQEIPIGAISLAGLEQAERARASESRRLQDGSAIGLLLGSERSRVADISLSNLTRDLPNGSLVYEETEPKNL